MNSLSSQHQSGLPGDFLKDLVALGEQVTFGTNQVIFRQGDKADFFYILTQGRVNISIGEEGHTVYTVSHPGEVFGWSCVMERAEYSATAEAMTDTRVVKIRAERVSSFFEKDPAKGIFFFKAVSRMLVNRLMQLYRLISEAPSVGLSYGTGQVMESSVER